MKIKQKGFTLIEVMVAMMIAAVGLLALASLLITGIKTNDTSELRMRYAARVASAMAAIEQNAVVGYTAATAVSDIYAQFGISPNVTLNPDPLVAGSAGIVISYRWIDRTGTHPVILHSRVEL